VLVHQSLTQRTAGLDRHFVDDFDQSHIGFAANTLSSRVEDDYFGLVCNVWTIVLPFDDSSPAFLVSTLIANRWCRPTARNAFLG